MAGLAGEHFEKKTVMIDATDLKAHRTTTGIAAQKGGYGRLTGRTKGFERKRNRPVESFAQERHTMLDAVADAKGRPLGFSMLAGQVSDYTGAAALLAVFRRRAGFWQIGVITAIPKKPVNIGQAARQRPCADVITDLTGGDEQVQRPPLAVADGVQLRVPFLGKTFHWTVSFSLEPRRPTDQTSTPPFLTPMLVAVRWAFRYLRRLTRTHGVRLLTSIITVFSSPCSAARPAISRATTPLSLHRFQRL